MKQKTMRAAAALMTAALALSSLTGCALFNRGGGQNGGAKGGLEVSLDHSYASEKVAVDGLNYAHGAINFGDKLLIAGSDQDYNELIMLYDPADGSTKEVKFAYPETLSDGAQAYPMSYFMDSDKHLNVIFNGYSWSVNDDGEEDYQNLGSTLEIYDADFNVIETRSLADVFGEDISINTVAANPAGGYYISAWDNSTGNQTVGIYDANFKKTGDLGANLQYLQGIYPADDGGAYILYEDAEWNNVFGKINPADNSIQPIDIEGMPQWFNSCIESHDDKYDFYVYDSEACYGVSCADGKCEEVINWLNSDFMGGYINDLTQLANGDFLLSSSGMGKDADGSSDLWRLTPRDPDAFKDVTMISMAGLYLPDELAQAVLEFNRTHDKERIAVVSYDKYSTEDDWQAGLKKLQTDMTSGVVADLIVTAGLPYESLANKGIFEDLTPYMSDITDADYFMNFFDSMRYGDKLYHIGFSYDVQTLVGKTDVVGTKQGLNNAEFMAMIKGLPSNISPFGTDVTKDSVLNIMATGNLKAYTDVKTGACSFNTPEFVEVLDFCNTFPSDYVDMSGMSDEEQMNYWNEQQYQYINGKAALAQTWVSDVKDCYRTQMQNFGEEKVTWVGYPVADENGGNGGRFSVYNTVAMSANSNVKEQCWDFMSYMFSDEYQENLSWSLPVKRSAFDKQVEEAMKPDTYTDENGKEVATAFTIWRGEEEVEVPDMPKSYADELRTYIEGIKTCSYYDQQVYDIIEEEAGMFFSGDQDAQKAADMIQSRVSLYLSEQG